MKLYYAPGACSLADRIALIESRTTYELEKIDLKEKRTEHGDDYAKINPKGYVPALELYDGEILERIRTANDIGQEGYLVRRRDACRR